jgi:hypothetical protein
MKSAEATDDSGIETQAAVKTQIITHHHSASICFFLLYGLNT